MRASWIIALAGLSFFVTVIEGLGETKDENGPDKLKEDKVLVKRVWMVNLEDAEKTRKQLSETIRQNMRIQEGNAYSPKDLKNLIERDVESVFETGDFILLDIQTQETEETKDAHLTELEVYYIAKSPNSKGLYKEGVLARVGEKNIYLNDLTRKLARDEIALKEQLLTSQIQPDTYRKKLNKLRKNLLDQEIVEAFSFEIYRKSPFQYPDYYFGVKERKIIREEYDGNRRALVDDLESKGKTYAEWRRETRDGVILASASEFLRKQGKTLTSKQIEAFYDSNIKEYLPEWQFGYTLPFFGSKKPGLPEYTPSEFISGRDSHGNPVLIEKIEDNTFTIGQIEISGNNTVPDALVRALIRLAPKESVNQEELFKSLIDISNLNLFLMVNCYFEERDQEKSKKVVVKCDEKDLSERVRYKEITVLPGTKEIYPCQFLGYINATNLVLPSGLEKIGYGAFANCKKLKKVEIPASVKEVEPLAFSYCQEIEKVILPDTIKSIKYGAFGDCNSLVSAPVPPAMTNALNVYNVFSGGYSLKEYVVSPKHPTLKDIDGVLFSKDGSKLIHYPSGRPEEIYKVPSGCSIIGEEAFERAQKIREIILPDSVSDIEKDAFWGLEKTIIHLPEKFTKASNQELEVMGLNPRTIRIRPKATPN